MTRVDSEADRLAALASLNEPMRRRLYGYLADQDTGVSRETAAAALGLSRSVVAFHLDKLADLGLLDVEFRRPEGRGGPGAGRPAKLYRRAAGEISLSVPERHYDVAALLLARAVEKAADGSISTLEALRVVAREHGHAIGIRTEFTEAQQKTPMEGLSDLLSRHGYAPRIEGNTMTLANCPFRALAEEHRELVCGMNHELITGVTEAAGIPAVARLDPAPGRCCVTLVAESHH
jgi:predicted ArsR family transcriptional regulator